MADSKCRCAGAGRADWSYLLDTVDHGTGHKMIVTRLVENGAETVRSAIAVKFR